MRRLAPLTLACALLLTGCQSAVEEAAPTVTRSETATPSESALPSASATSEPSGTVTGGLTKVVNVNPFTPDGKLAGSFTTGQATGSPVVCSDDKGSPNAVSNDTHACGPASLRAQACWRSPFAADEGKALYCLTNPWSTQLIRREATQIPASTTKGATAVPLGIELVDGSRWAYYGGGGWQGYPSGYTPLYECVEKCKKSQALGQPEGGVLMQQTGPTWGAIRLDSDTGGAERVGIATVHYIESTMRPDVYPTAAPTTEPTPTTVDTPSESPSASPSDSPSATPSAGGSVVSVGKTVRSRSDVDGLTGVGEGFKAYLRGQVASTSCRGGIEIARYGTEGSAAGQKCGKSAYWSKASGAWQEVWTGSGTPRCSVLSQAKLPTDVVAGSCLKNGQRTTYTLD